MKVKFDLSRKGISKSRAEESRVTLKLKQMVVDTSLKTEGCRRLNLNWSDRLEIEVSRRHKNKDYFLLQSNIAKVRVGQAS